MEFFFCHDSCVSPNLFRVFLKAARLNLSVNKHSADIFSYNIKMILAMYVCTYYKTISAVLPTKMLFKAASIKSVAAIKVSQRDFWKMALYLKGSYILLNHDLLSFKGQWSWRPYNTYLFFSFIIVRIDKPQQ